MLRKLLDNKTLFKVLLLFTLVFVSASAFMKGVETPLHNDKLEHFFTFGTLAFIVHHALRAGFAKQAVLLFAYGAWIELVQYFLPYRSSAFNDFMADVAGVCAYHALYQIYDWMRQERLIAF